MSRAYEEEETRPEAEEGYGAEESPTERLPTKDPSAGRTWGTWMAIGVALVGVVFFAVGVGLIMKYNWDVDEEAEAQAETEQVRAPQKTETPAGRETSAPASPSTLSPSTTLPSTTSTPLTPSSTAETNPLERETSTERIYPPTRTAYTDPTVVPEKRLGKFLFCTLGTYAFMNDYYQNSACDYLIFSDITYLRGDIVGRDDHEAWKNFLAYAGKMNRVPTSWSHGRVVHMGASFNVEDLATITQRTQSGVLVTNMRWLTDRFRMTAFGFLGLEGNFSSIREKRRTMEPTYSDISAIFEESAVPNPYPFRTRFLGLRITDVWQGAKHFQRFLLQLLPLDLLVLQTHITDAPDVQHRRTDCIISPVSAWNKSFYNASYHITLQEAADVIQNLPSSKLSVAVSLTMGVMHFVKPNSTEKLMFGGKCNAQYLSYYDVVCDKDVSHVEMSAVAYEGDSMYTFEDNVTIASKFEMMVNRSQTDNFGWALFDIQFDIYRCDSPSNVVHIFDRVTQLKKLLFK
ncbi:uncharacterized protein LOC135401041 isoform X2 [Ornithodoros turicata]|uniref:uncharacterized protein LOC135401041 isoform X2 n=1 Tax=Ornithodoros turicata TaxID=34597 RepID=UPI00313901A8